jgi:hypothetical protein
VNYSRCILRLWRPPYTKLHAIKHHVLAHSRPEDLLSGIHALLARLNLNHWVRPRHDYLVFDPNDGAWTSMNHWRQPTFGFGHSQTIMERQQEYTRVFDLQNQGRLTLLQIYLDRSRLDAFCSDARVDEALRHAAATAS